MFELEWYLVEHIPLPRPIITFAHAHRYQPPRHTGFFIYTSRSMHYSLRTKMLLPRNVKECQKKMFLDLFLYLDP